jgi:hypothetical protein
MLTLDELITDALAAKEKSPLGGGTVVHHCEEDREYIAATKAFLDTDPEHPEDGAVFLVCIGAIGGNFIPISDDLIADYVVYCEGKAEIDETPLPFSDWRGLEAAAREEFRQS